MKSIDMLKALIMKYGGAVSTGSAPRHVWEARATAAIEQGGGIVMDSDLHIELDEGEELLPIAN